jgi:hypothetical protein
VRGEGLSEKQFVGVMVAGIVAARAEAAREAEEAAAPALGLMDAAAAGRQRVQAQAAAAAAAGGRAAGGSAATDMLDAGALCMLFRKVRRASERGPARVPGEQLAR